ncbi:L,D-transpeptidase scaffold domain-containing protein [Mucilaginibacter boryungensis]|uniref:L,D-transpeptidase family protein n=1 Tax=Mucilaginibacter boryungensis TaxID=768480 RepID=A0ABR9XEU6_9SPHI|nr:L,D-transpeptidase family protein [Mucilaginibacter boryungensis]MBE9665707.1 L,D-transpeptidase family protein [Mucilaginibacter boryungensis]
MKALRSTALTVILFIAIFSFNPVKAAIADTSLADNISTQLHNKKQLPLYFPLSVKRFYTARDFKPVWLKKEKGETGHAWQAMLLLDCVLQYGLAHADYHPDELRYDLLHDIFEKPGSISKDKQARFELMLTDAMFTLMNHLHYGKLNPEYPANRIDAGLGGSRVEAILGIALAQADISPTLLAVQPKSVAYLELQQWMHKWKGQYVGDCYEVPEENVRKVAINMERLRWADIGEGPYMQVNIPSFMLSVYLADSTYQFKIVTGSPTTPTPLLKSEIYAVTAVPRLEIPGQLRTIEVTPRSIAKQAGLSTSLLVFPFASRYKIDMIEMTAPDWFKSSHRAFSRGNIGVEAPEKLASLLLKADGQANQSAMLLKTRQGGKGHVFRLKAPMPLKITYLTCFIKDGQLVNYEDVYQLDAKLEQAIYHTLPDRLAGR